jgi:hypothetical protein
LNSPSKVAGEGPERGVRDNTPHITDASITHGTTVNISERKLDYARKKPLTRSAHRRVLKTMIRPLLSPAPQRCHIKTAGVNQSIGHIKISHDRANAILNDLKKMAGEGPKRGVYGWYWPQLTALPCTTEASTTHGTTVHVSNPKLD